MSVIFKVEASSGPYQVQIGANLQITSERENSFSIADELVFNLWKDIIPTDAFTVLAVEQNKTLETSSKIIEAMRSKGVQRGSHLKAFGGGIIQDLATVTSSLYMRGIGWTYYPTTLLGMVDSCIGGKSSINVGRYKNIAGNFYPPQEIIIDVEFCKTLSTPEQVAGLCEAVKICYAAKNDSFDQYVKNFLDLPLPFSSEQLLRLVELSLLTKKTFIEEDEFDNGVRLLLNFGHTIGHAIEAATHFSITHGVAIGIGMLAEIRMGMLLSGLNELPERAKLLDLYIRRLLKNIPYMVNTIRNLDVSTAFEAFKSDKKHTDQSYVIVVLDNRGYLKRVSIPVSEDINRITLEIFEWVKKDFLL
ncbi:3-dehydroquinate synthase family protein [Polynucleobacter sp. AP-Kolm-20A-A1]|uniref:3-dehydroquinate synthase n=1 Tax=Polynucleobacter sp. AP-Kolm-20A-A1 TaxID=2081041 RepID=UPI001BFE01F5|nr:3-dehydroquinate synthase family protein [Polynucleobacter sp. AP-Kolm-20A-A1]QWE20923.1 3-dehydroquinate synthase [Polynucleobacter sp. AP-Kolm-20A-A1]